MQRAYSRIVSPRRKFLEMRKPSLKWMSDSPQRDRPAWLAFGREVNEGLDACGYPLCKGNVMACNPAFCLSVEEWRQAFLGWIEQGSPRDVLAASICFDLRPLTGAVGLAAPLDAEIGARAAAVPRFLKQMAEDALRQPSPLNWRGAVDTTEVDGRPMFDLKLQGTSIFVAAARLYALAHGVRATGTRARLEAVAPKLGASPRESGSWVVAFEFLQMLRLRIQLHAHDEGEAIVSANPNRIDVAGLSDAVKLKIEGDNAKMVEGRDLKLKTINFKIEESYWFLTEFVLEAYTEGTREKAPLKPGEKVESKKPAPAANIHAAPTTIVAPLAPAVPLAGQPPALGQPTVPVAGKPVPAADPRAVKVVDPAIPAAAPVNPAANPVNPAAPEVPKKKKFIVPTAPVGPLGAPVVPQAPQVAPAAPVVAPK